MHPHAGDAGIAAIAHDLLRRLGPRDDDDAVDASGDRAHVGIAAIAIERLQVRVYREHVVTGPLQTPVDQIGRPVAALVARHAGDGEALLCEKVEGFHGCLRSATAAVAVLRAAAQMVLISWSESRVSGRSSV